MALSNRLGAPPKRSTGTPCSVGALEDYLADTAEGTALHSMLYLRGWSGRRVWDEVQAEAKELVEAGDIEGAAVHAKMSLQQVNRHRSHGCRCFL